MVGVFSDASSPSLFYLFQARDLCHSPHPAVTNKKDRVAAWRRGRYSAKHGAPMIGVSLASWRESQVARARQREDEYPQSDVSWEREKRRKERRILNESLLGSAARVLKLGRRVTDRPFRT